MSKSTGRLFAHSMLLTAMALGLSSLAKATAQALPFSLPPEINSARMFAGAGPGSLTAGAAWDSLAAELSAAADSFSSITEQLSKSGEYFIYQSGTNSNTASTEFFNSPEKAPQSLDHTGTVWKCKNLDDKDKCALILAVNPKFAALNEIQFVDVYFAKQPDEAKQQVSVWFLVQPSKDKPAEVVLIGKRLTEFEVVSNGETSIRRIPMRTVIPQTNADAHLVKIVLMVSGKAEVSVREFVLGTAAGTSHGAGQHQVLLTTMRIPAL